MAGKRARRTKIHRRSHKGKKSFRFSHRASAAAFRPKPLTRYPALRTFQCYPQIVDSDKAVKSNWLSQLYKYGCMALHLFTLALTGPFAVSAISFAVTSAVQGFILGIDDFILDSPLCETTDGKNHYSCFDYCQGKCSSVTVTITPGSELSKRAGRYVVAIVLLTREQALRYLSEVADHRVVKDTEYVGFDTLLQYPGAISCPADKPTQIQLRTSGFSNEWHEVGSVKEPQDTSKFSGGLPLVKVLFGYRDVASTTGAYNSLYSADESLIQMDVNASMSFKEPGRRYIRTTPLKTCSDTEVSLVMGSKTRRVPLEAVSLGETGLLEVAPEYLEDEDEFEIIPNLKSLRVKSP